MILGLNELLLVFMLPADIDRQLLFELFDLCLIFYVDGRLGNNWSAEDRYFLIEAFDFWFEIGYHLLGFGIFITLSLVSPDLINQI